MVLELSVPYLVVWCFFWGCCQAAECTGVCNTSVALSTCTEQLQQVST